MRPSRLALFVTALLSLGSCRAGSSKPSPSVSYAWWVTAVFNPSREIIEGIPVRTLDSTWAAALPLTRSALPIEAERDPSALADSSVAFAVDGDFNRDGVPDRALVGVYRSVTGETGRFLLILTRRDNGWAKAELAKQVGKPGFSVLTQAGDTLKWWECMECDVAWTVAWNGRQYAVVLPDSGEPE